MSYFYQHEAEQFTFYRIPKALFTNKKYNSMSTDAKVLYGLLLDRVGLSIKNNWIDEFRRVYIIFTRDETQELLNISDRTATKLFKELIKYDLIEEIRQGLNKPNIIYVKKFYETIENTLNRKNYDSGTEKITIQEPKKLRCNNTDFNNTDFNDISQSIDDGPTDDLQQILDKAQIDIYREKEKTLLTNTIKKLLSLKTLTVNNTSLDQDKIREQLHKINMHTCDYALRKFTMLQEQEHIKIKNKSKYFMILLFNSIDEVHAEL